MKKLRVLEVSGTLYDMGYQHGSRYAREIHELTEERVLLSMDERWAGQRLSREQVMALGDACLAEHQAYAPDLMEELQGMSAATGLTLTELVILNGFTDFVDVVACHRSETAAEIAANPGGDDCTAFVVSPDAAAAGRGFVGQTWDMHATATPFVILLRGRPKNKPAFLVFTIVGCVGMIGMNDAGIAIGINNLVCTDGRPGVTWPFVVRKALEQTNLDDALACITSAKLAGAHNYFLADGNGRAYNVEAMATSCHVEAVRTGSYVHTNHCLYSDTKALERARLPESQANSESRLNRGQTLLAQGRVTPELLMALTRDRGALNGICVLSEAPFFVETSGAAIICPATREFWAAWGPPIYTEYERFVI